MQVDLWKITLDWADEAQHNLRYLNPDELKRYHRFHFSKHKAQFLQTRVAVKTILGRYLNQAPETLNLEEDKNSKPFIRNSQALTFNVSHSGGRALLVVGKTHPVGVDIECFSDRPYTGIARHVFSEQEQVALNALPQSLQALAFFNIWTQKEALIKAIGLGLRYPTARVDLPLFAQDAYLCEDPLEQQSWRIQPFMPEPGFAAALCYHPSVMKVQYFTYHETSAPSSALGM